MLSEVTLTNSMNSLIGQYSYNNKIMILTSGFNRAQILYYIAENLELRKSEFAERISSLTGKSVELSASEVDKSINRLFYWAAFADKYGGAVQVEIV